MMRMDHMRRSAIGTISQTRIPLRSGKTTTLLAVALLMIFALAPNVKAQTETTPAGEQQTPSTAQAAAPPAPSLGPAAPQAAAQPTIGGALLPHDLSPLGMFVHDDIVVKAVILGLAFASLVAWTAFVAKSLELQTARRRARRGLRILAGAATLGQA